MKRTKFTVINCSPQHLSASAPRTTWSCVAQSASHESFDADGNLYVADGYIRKIDKAGTVSTWAKATSIAIDLAFGPDGTLYVAQGKVPVISSFDKQGKETILVRATRSRKYPPYGPFAQADFGLLLGLAIGTNGFLYVADQSNRSIWTIYIR